MKIKQLAVSTPQGESGPLCRGSRFDFRYDTHDHARAISLTMPIRADSYGAGALPPIFTMNRPEGFLYERITRQLAGFPQVDALALLAATGEHQIGRLRVHFPEAEVRALHSPIGLQQLLREPASAALFEYLVDAFKASGISGVQPKVMLPDADLIVKAGGEDYPHLPVNEFLCMDAARRAGISVPNFWLSDSGELLVLERFDRSDDRQLGFEDMAVLTGAFADSQGRYKYEGSYERIARMIGEYCAPAQAAESLRRFFEYVTLSVMTRNGDAHLKNFGLLYEHPATIESITLAPLYDVVTTSVYEHRDVRSGEMRKDSTLALKLNKKRKFPIRRELLRFGEDSCQVHDAAAVIERLGDAMAASLSENRHRVDPIFFQKMKAEWDDGRLSVEPDRFMA